MAKPEHEFFPVKTIPWTKVAGADVGMTERILAKDPDANGVQVHDIWEEVYILEGAFEDLELKQTFRAGEYACRPPGMRHGPWRSDTGCITFEVRYYSKK